MDATKRNFASEKRLLHPLHMILQRNMLNQALFFYIQGIQAVNPEVSVTIAIRSFCDRYYPNENEESLMVGYYRMLNDYLNDSKIVK